MDDLNARVKLALSILEHGQTDPGRAVDEAKLALQGATIVEILRLREGAA